MSHGTGTERIYRIKNWKEDYETAQTRRVKGQLRWVLVPTRHDGKSFRRLLREPDGAALFGAWVVILQVAAKCPTRGVLADGDGPLSAHDIADKTGFPPEVIERALEMLSSKGIGWLEVLVRACSEHAPSVLLPSPAHAPSMLGESTAGEERRREERKEVNGPDGEITKEIHRHRILSSKLDDASVRVKAAIAVSAALQGQHVFDHWKEVMNHPRAIFGKKRKSAVMARLKEGYTEEQLNRAIDGCKCSAYHQGDNKDHTVYDDLELICRHETHVDKFIAYLERQESGANNGTGTGTNAGDSTRRETASERNVRNIEESFRRLEHRYGAGPDHRPDSGKEPHDMLASLSESERV